MRRGLMTVAALISLLFMAVIAPSQELAPAPFVVLPGKIVGNFSLGMTREEMLRVAPKPQEHSSERLVYASQKTGNTLTAHFQNNKIVQIAFTSKDFYTEAGIHTGNFREAQYASLFTVQERPGTLRRLQYTLKTGGLTFYGTPDSLSRAIGVVHAGLHPVSDVESMRGEAQRQTQGTLTENIPLMKMGGVYRLPIEVNGVITLHFILDTGASEVNIPEDVALTLSRTGTIQETDFLPGQTYRLADGSIVRSARLLLKSLKIGNRRITNVPASIGERDSLLLLGQSFLEKLGSWGMDSQKQLLTIGARAQRGQHEVSISLPSTPTEQLSSSLPSRAVGETGNTQLPGASVMLPTTKTGDTYIIEHRDLDNLKPSYGVERKVVSVDKEQITVAAKSMQSKTGKARILQFTSEWNLVSSRNLDGSGFNYSPPLKYFAFPLYPGKRWQQMSRETNIQTGAVREHTLSATVGDWEDISVPAGKFRAIKITIQTELLDRSTEQKSTGIDLSWYAPAIRRSVRSEIISRDFQAQQERQLIHMIQYDLK